MKRILLLIFFLLQGSTLSADTSPPSIFYLKEQNGKCQWILQNVVDKEKRVISTTSGCPQEIIWDFPRKRTIYLEGNTLYAFSREEGGEERR